MQNNFTERRLPLVASSQSITEPPQSRQCFNSGERDDLKIIYFSSSCGWVDCMSVSHPNEEDSDSCGQSGSSASQDAAVICDET